MIEAVETRLEVRWGECDPAGIVYHPAYIDWFSVARMHFLSENGIQYMDTFHVAKIHLLVTDVACKYIKALRAEDQITVVARLVERSRARLMFVYDVLNDAGEVCATGHTRHAFVQDGSNKPVNLEKAAAELWAHVSALPVSVRA
ncbi:acyl-CoA thioesterase [Alicyclobacillus dauci]|uniref:Acyl-CoA thioesterase n=1 Tax=Alicyclobacillus dauci TaxID=1475485 RepID=A0ABY6Z6G1_9BACL|nr:acyl-CoA thioesterase [Alicyclobacillus dauci]WAH38335.1 acyl-CoA thioesterase [Alicyclobacillus dauci]